MKLKKYKSIKIKDLIALRKEQSVRNSCKKILITDAKTCFEIPGEIEQLIVIEGFKGELPPHKSSVFVKTADLARISGMKHHPDFVAIVAKPSPISKKIPSRIIFLDHLQNPGNMGTIIRSALAFNFDALYYTENSCDPFNDKTLRAAKSAIFHLPIFKIKTEQFIEKFNDFTFYQADLVGQSLDSVTIDQKSVLILSNEGSGPCSTFNCKKIPITIHMNQKVESLNVSAAANILMYHFNNQQPIECKL